MQQNTQPGNKPEKKDKTTIDLTTLGSLGQEVEAAQQSPQTSTEQSQKYRLMAEILLSHLKDDTSELLKEIQYQISLWVARQMNLKVGDKELETIMLSFAGGIDKMVKALSSSDSEDFTKSYHELAINIHQYLFSNRMVSIINPSEAEQQEQEEATIKAVLATESPARKVVVTVLSKLLSKEEYELIIKLINEFNRGEQSLDTLKSELNKRLKKSSLANSLDVNADDVFTAAGDAADQIGQRSTAEQMVGKIGDIVGLDMLSTASDMPAIFRNTRILKLAAKHIGIDLKILKKLKHENLLELQIKLNDKSLMDSLAKDPTTYNTLLKLREYLNSGAIQEMASQFAAAANNSDLDEDIRMEMCQILENPEHLTLETLLLCKFDLQGEVSFTDLVGQRILQTLNIVRRLYNIKVIRSIKEPYKKGIALAQSEVRSSQSKILSPRERIERSYKKDVADWKKNGEKGPKPKRKSLATVSTKHTDDALRHTRDRVSKLNLKNLHELSPDDLNRKLGQFNVYIEDFSKHSARLERDLLHILETSTDQSEISSAKKALHKHKMNHAAAIDEFNKLGAQLNDATQQRYGKLMNKTGAEASMDNVYRQQAQNATDDLGKHLDEVLPDKKLTVSNITDDIKWGTTKTVAKVGALGALVLGTSYASNDGQTGLKKLGINITETAGMFVPVVGTILTFRQAITGETMAGDKIGGWDTWARWSTLGFAILQLGTDVASIFGGVGVGMRAALVSTKLGSGSAKAVLAAQKAPMLGRAVAKLTYKLGSSGRARYLEKLMKNSKDLQKLSKMRFGEAFGSGFKAGDTLRSTLMSKSALKTAEYAKGIKTSQTISGKLGNLAGAGAQGLTTFAATILTACNLPLRFLSGCGKLIGRTALPIRQFVNAAKLKAVAATLKARPDEIMSALQLFRKYQQNQLRLVANNRQLAMHTDEIFRLGKLHNINKLDDPIRVLGELQKFGKLDPSTAKKLYEQIKSGQTGIRKLKKDILQQIPGGKNNITQLFASMAKIDSATKLERRMEKLVNSSTFGLSVINKAEKALLGGVVASVLSPLILGTDWSTVPSYLWKGTKATVGATTDAAVYMVAGGRGGQHEQWYNHADRIGVKTAIKRRMVLKFMEMTLAQLASLYFNRANLSKPELDALLIVIDQKGYSMSDLINSYYSEDSSVV